MPRRHRRWESDTPTPYPSRAATTLHARTGEEPSLRQLTHITHHPGGLACLALATTPRQAGRQARTSRPAGRPTAPLHTRQRDYAKGRGGRFLPQQVGRPLVPTFPTPSRKGAAQAGVRRRIPSPRGRRLASPRPQPAAAAAAEAGRERAMPG